LQVQVAVGLDSQAMMGDRPFKPARKRALDESGAGPTDGDFTVLGG
jgi:hypothetical protein